MSQLVAHKVYGPVYTEFKSENCMHSKQYQIQYMNWHTEIEFESDVKNLQRKNTNQSQKRIGHMAYGSVDFLH